METDQVPTAADFMAASATKTLNMGEMDALITESVNLWAIHEEKDKAAKEARKEAEAVDLKIMQALRDAGKSKYHVDGIGTVSISQKASVKVPGSINEKLLFFNYLNEQSEDLFMSLASVNSNTLNSWFNAELEAAAARGEIGFKVPGIGDPITRETLRFTTEKKGKKP